MMLSKALLRRVPSTAVAAAAGGSGRIISSGGVGGIIGGSSTAGAGSALIFFDQEHQQQQVRQRWTKAKKKRFARYERRQEMERLGQSLPKPPYYFPKDTPVANVRPKEEVLEESKKFDEHAAAEMKARLDAQRPTLRHHMTDNLRMSDRVRRLFDLHNGSQMEVVKAQKKQGMELFQLRPGDTGSSAVQVIALTTRIQQLQTHMQKHRKDYHSKRGLDALYVRRRKLLDYMERRDFDNYRKVVKTLGLVR